MHQVPTEAGFSLVELMITVVIATIIAAFVIPGYQHHMQRSYLPEASSGLLLSAMRLEQYYQDNRSYRDDAVCGVTLPVAKRFSFSCTPAVDGQTFLLTATGLEQGMMHGFAFTLDQSGNARTVGLPDNWGNAPMDCWITRQEGKC